MEKQEQAKPVRGQNLLEWYEALISAALVLVLIFSFFFRIIQVDGSSMVPTLVNGDKLIVWGAGYTPQRGDVVIVDSYTSYGKPLVKRVIAKGGDTVSIDYATGTVAVNGEVLQEDYIAEPTYLGYDVTFPYTVPEGTVFVMGDNRNQSLDSRSTYVGCIDERPCAAGCPHPAFQPEPGDRAHHGPQAETIRAEQGRSGRPGCNGRMDQVFPCGRCRLCGHQRQAEGRCQCGKGCH